MVYHVINRANARLPIFQTADDYNLFETVLTEVKERTDMRILAYCIMPNHWHLILYPRNDGDLSRFTGLLAMTHTQRWHSAHQSIGTGHLYQGRYKSFPVQTDEYFLWVCRYVERNPLRAQLVKRAEHWRWSSTWRRENGTHKHKQLLDPWPTDPPKNYLDWLNEQEDNVLLERVRTSINRGKPFGSPAWVERIIKKFNLYSTIRPRGRPKKGS
ncbi:transposase [Candidatus Uhrbacteria bacterium]|nr:transposase [Candidatus Uhrbacteria bacterium]